jgi:hypothetical protein
MKKGLSLFKTITVGGNGVSTSDPKGNMPVQKNCPLGNS